MTKRVAITRPPTPKARAKGNYRMGDSLENLITGMGTERDKLRSTQFIFTEMDKLQLEMAYRSDWIARKVVDIPAQDATREWRSWQSDMQDINDIEELERKLFLQKKIKCAMQKARLYGGAALLLGVDQGSVSSELDPMKVQKDGLKFIHVVSRYELSSGDIEWDIDNDNYGMPQWYQRAGQAAVGKDVMQKIHPSRVVRFTGTEVPDIRLTNGWGDSVLQVVNDAILAAGTVNQNGAQLMSEIKMDVIKIPDLTASLSQKDYAKRLNDRFALANVSKSLYNVLLLDVDEEWERIEANLAGLPDVLKMYLLIASGAADIPATRMLGQSPSGLSATGESDMRNYYDHVKSEQQTTLQPALTILDQVLIRSALGDVDPKDVTYMWNPLWQMDEQQKSTILKQKAESFKTDVDAGLIPSEVLRDARINQLLEDGVYPGLEQILDDYGPLDPIDDNPEEGSVIGPDGQPISPNDPRHPANQPQIDPKTGKPISKPAAAAGSNVVPFGKTPKPKKVIGDMAARIRRANPRSRKYRAMDGVTRTLYVRRDVLNAGDILKWAKAQKIPNLEAASELHVTIMYSKTAVDWSKTGDAYGQDEKGNMTIKPGGMRALQKFNDALVLCFNSSELGWRHCQIKETTGATWDYEDYQPHVTLAYLKEPFDFSKIEAYQGEIKLGPEIYAEVTPDYQGGEANAV